MAQHFLVQRIQKIYEMKEFLNLVKIDTTRDEQQECNFTPVIKSISAWKQRTPSQSFDPLHVWDDISQARQLFIEQYCMKFQHSFPELHQTLIGNQLSQRQSQSQSNLL